MINYWALESIENMTFVDKPSTLDVPIPRRSSISNQQPVSSNSVRSSIQTCLCHPRACRIYFVTGTVVWILLLSLFIFALVIDILAETGESWSKMVAHTPGFYWTIVVLGILTLVGGVTLAGYAIWNSRRQSALTPVTP
jgi:hypothetical protein